MKKVLPTSLLLAMLTTSGFAQTGNPWSPHLQSASKIIAEKAVSRKSFPETFKLFDLNMQPLQQTLTAGINNRTSNVPVIISLPNAAGSMEQFEVREASNFEPALQALYPEIRAFSGKGITDKTATLKLSLSPQGLQTMIFRIENENEFIEPYSRDHTVYAVFTSQRSAHINGWTCSTQEAQMIEGINTQVAANGFTARSGADLKTIRLAQSVTAEYSNYFGATSAAQEGLVLAAINATLTRCNGVYEKDLALHLNLVAASTGVIYYNAATDPYDAAATGAQGTWNVQLQRTLDAVVGNANYDIGHLFGASGGGGNAGCIGCVCNTWNGQTSANTFDGKGGGFTSPSDAIPQGDNFDIDYVTHEVGHQLGANHTYSYVNEGTGVNKEIGSGITIMGYAGITPQDVANHSIDIYHAASIAQIQTVLASKTCPVTINVAGTNATPVVAAAGNFTIPISTPFALTGSATDANPGDVLTYCWEQNDNAGSSQTGAGSIASPAKTSGPNFLSVRPTVSPVRFFPKLSTILAGGLTSGPLPGGDAGITTEALSSVSRTLNFRLTVRDNAVYSSAVPVSVGQTSFTDMAVTVSNTSGPFAVTSPNTGVTWAVGTLQNITWSVNGTTAAPVSCANVAILLSVDAGNTFTTLVASTPNDGTETIGIPNTPSATCRIKVEAVGNIFFDISNTDFTIGGTAPACGEATALNATNITNNSATLGWTAVPNALSYDAEYKLSSATTYSTLVTSTTATSAALSGLAQGSLYDWRIKANCPAGAGNYAAAQFTTTVPNACPGTLDAATNNTVAGAGVLPLNIDAKGTISSSSDVDYYKFVIANGGTATITLNTLPADYDMRLYSSNGTTQLAISQNSNTTAESISRTYTAGTYYIKVYGYSGANSTTCYTLKVATGTASRINPAAVANSKNQLSIYPNPVRDELTINTGLAEMVYVTITDMYGNNVLTTTASEVKNINMQTLGSGVYLVTIINRKGGKIKQEKIIKQ